MTKNVSTYCQVALWEWRGAKSLPVESYWCNEDLWCHQRKVIGKYSALVTLPGPPPTPFLLRMWPKGRAGSHYCISVGSGLESQLRRKALGKEHSHHLLLPLVYSPKWMSSRQSGVRHREPPVTRWQVEWLHSNSSATLVAAWLMARRPSTAHHVFVQKTNQTNCWEWMAVLCRFLTASLAVCGHICKERWLGVPITKWLSSCIFTSPSDPARPASIKNWSWACVTVLGWIMLCSWSVIQSNLDFAESQMLSELLPRARWQQEASLYLRLNGFPLINPRHHSSAKSFPLGNWANAAL